MKAAPFAGAIDPLALHVMVAWGNGLTPGVYRYRPERHELTRVLSEDRHAGLLLAAHEQECVAAAPVVVAKARGSRLSTHPVMAACSGS